MSGIIAALGSAVPNIIYTPNLLREVKTGYANGNTNFFVAPLTSSYVAGPVTQSYTDDAPDQSIQWTGYLRPSVSGSIGFALSATGNTFLAYNYFWLGPKAISEFSAGNADITNFSGTSSTNLTVTAGQYYPIRIQMAYFNELTPGGGTFMNFSFSVNGSTSVSVFYNSLTGRF